MRSAQDGSRTLYVDEKIMFKVPQYRIPSYTYASVYIDYWRTVAKRVTQKHSVHSRIRIRYES